MTRRLEEEISNVVPPPYGEQVPPLEEDANVEKAPTNPRPLTDKNISTALLQMAQDITTHAQVSMTQAQAKTLQAKPRGYALSSSASHYYIFSFKDFTRMNPPTFYGYIVDEEL